MKRTFMVVVLLAMASTAHADLTPEERAMLDRISSDPAAKTEAMARLSKSPAPARRARSAMARAIQPPPVAADVAATAKPVLANPEYSPCAGWQFLLRQDWKDIDLLRCAGDAKDAAGAQVSYTDDMAARNRIWAIDGTVAVNYNSLMDPTYWWQPTYTNYGAYASLDRTYNSAASQAASNADKLAYGAYMQVGYTAHTPKSFFRVRGGMQEDHIRNTSASSVTAEYIPVYDPLYIHYPTPSFHGYVLRFDPTLFARYSSVTGIGKVLAFNNSTEALRVGTQAVLRLLPGLGAGDITPFRATLTYAWATEVYSGRNLSWFQTDLTYNLDSAGHIALGFTYKNGNDQDTGVFANSYRIGLTGKI
ncbi:hypothetical protein [Bradyrhizobium sp. USDA 4451]